MDDIIFECGRSIGCYGTFDVAVAGGGFAGVAAALSAARSGAATCLIEKTCAPGGLGTLGLVVDYLPLCDGRGTKLVGGIGEELLRLSGKYGKTDFPACWRPDGDTEARKEQRYELTYSPASMILLMEELLLEAGVSIFYDTRVCALSMQRRTIEALIVENSSGRGAICCKSVVDATGDAVICAFAGEQTAESDKNVCAWWFYGETKNGLKLNRKTDNFYRITPDMPLYSGTDHADVTALCVETRNRIRVFTQAVNNGCAAGLAGGELSHDGSSEVRTAGAPDRQYPAILPMIPQFRMTQRVITDYQLDEADAGRWFEDCIGLTGDWRKRGPRYSIPYRAICATQTENLLVAGRCISTTEAGWDIMRVIPTCAVTGEAAGAACALAAMEHGGSVHDLPIEQLQKHLRQQGVILDRTLFGPAEN